jgi:hypothetical protein
VKRVITKSTWASGLGVFLFLVCGIAASVLHAQQMPTAQQRRLAPDGVFYLLQPVTITGAPSGVINVPAGSAVLLASANGDTFRVTPDGTTLVDLHRSLMTNDLNVLAAVLPAAAQQRQRELQQAVEELQQRREAAAQRQAEQEYQAALQRQAKQELIDQRMRAMAEGKAQAQARDEQRQASEFDRQQAEGQAEKAQNRIDDLERQVNTVRSDEFYEYNKAAKEKGNRATYEVEEAADRKIEHLEREINDARNQQP